MKKYGCIIFDLDGTLLDTIDDLAASMNAVLTGLGCGVHSVESYKYFVGDGMAELARRSLPPDRRDRETLERCIAGMRMEYGKRWQKETRPYEGIDDLLDFLEELGMPTAVLSNKPDDFTRLCVKHFFPSRRFAAVMGVKPGIQPKPHPAGALNIAKRLNIPPEEFLFVGDTGTDMRTAAAAGMFPAGALWGFRTAAELQDGGARVLMKRPAGLLRLIQP